MEIHSAVEEAEINTQIIPYWLQWFYLEIVRSGYSITHKLPCPGYLGAAEERAAPGNLVLFSYTKIRIYFSRDTCRTPYLFTMS